MVETDPGLFGEYHMRPVLMVPVLVPVCQHGTIRDKIITMDKIIYAVHIMFFVVFMI